MEAAPSLFTGRRGVPNEEQELEAKVAALEAKLRKGAIIAEVSEEYVKLKKQLGAP